MNMSAHHSRIIWLLISVVLLLGSGCVAQPSTVASISPTGLDNAFDVRDEEDRLHSQSYESLIKKGNQHLAKGDYNLAKVHFIKASNLNESPSQALAGLGKVEMLSGSLDTARQTFLKALEYEAGNRLALLGLGRINRIQGNYAEAENYFQELIDANPLDPEALTEMAINYDDSGQEELAEPLYAKVVELRPSASAFNNLGFNQLLQGKYGASIKTLQHARFLNPADKRIRNNLAAGYILNGEERMGLDLFESTVGQAAAFNNVGYIYLTQGNWAAAEQSLNRAMELNPAYYAKAKKNLSYMKSLQAKDTEQPASPAP